jgi:hypothetical protein
MIDFMIKHGVFAHPDPFSRRQTLLDAVRDLCLDGWCPIALHVSREAYDTLDRNEYKPLRIIRNDYLEPGRAAFELEREGPEPAADHRVCPRPHLICAVRKDTRSAA